MRCAVICPHRNLNPPLILFRIHMYMCEKVTFVLTQVLGALHNMAPMHILFFGSRG